MTKQPYIYYLIVLGGVGWDKKELLKSNLHVYGRDNTKIVIYSTGKMTHINREKIIKSRQ